MARKKKEKSAGEAENAVQSNPAGQTAAGSQSKNIFAAVNRGMLLDMVVFLLNIFLMRMLTSQFVGLIDKAGKGDEISEIVMFLFFIGVFVLPVAGAVLRRWHFHHRLQMQGKAMGKDGFTFGCLFNPIVFYCLNLLIFITIDVFVTQYFYGDNAPKAVESAVTILSVIIPAIQTFLIYRYFLPPKKEPGAFFKSPLSELLGDACIFLNMILFQLGWNWLMFSFFGFPRVSGVEDFFGKLFFLIGMALLIYFPPRIFYLAEDAYRRRTWLTILLANAPLIFRALIGVK